MPRKKSIITFILGLTSFGLYILSYVFKEQDFKVYISVIQMTTALLGSFIGTPNLVILLFKGFFMGKKDGIFLVLGTLLSFTAFGLSNYGAISFYLLPAIVLPVLIYQLLLLIPKRKDKRSDKTIMQSLESKISQMEKELDQTKPE